MSLSTIESDYTPKDFLEKVIYPHKLSSSETNSKVKRPHNNCRNIMKLTVTVNLSLSIIVTIKSMRKQQMLKGLIFSPYKTYGAPEKFLLKFILINKNMYKLRNKIHLKTD